MNRRVLVSVAALASLAIAFLAPRVFAGSDGYELDVLGVAEVDAPAAEQSEDRQGVKVRFEVAWDKEDGFPGTRNCEWTVFNESGDVIGRTSSTLTSMEAVPDAIYKEMFVEAGERVGNAAISCDPTRLDNPAGSFEFSGVHVVTPSSNQASDLDVFFKHGWTGGGLPTPQKCEIDVFDESGELLFKSPRNFHSVGIESRSSNFSIEAPEEFKDYDFSSTTAGIRCSAIG